MWTIVVYDLPTETKKQRRDAQLFRKNILKDGFNMFQFSIYLRHCSSKENADTHKNRVIKHIPEHGKIGILQITDKQFERMDIFYGKKADKLPTIPKQLEMF